MKKIEEMKIVVVGTGAFGTAMANQFIKKTNRVFLYGISEPEVHDIEQNHRNSAYFRTRLNSKLRATLDPVVFSDADIIVLALPSNAISPVLKDVIIPNQRQRSYFINLSKGYDYINQTTIMESIEKTLPQHRKHAVMKLSGPSFASDVIRNKLTYFDLASRNIDVAKYFAEALTTDSIKIHPTKNVLDAELNSMLKNPYAILMGIIAGLGYKENTTAALFTSCIIEMQMLVSALGGNKENVISASGIGDFFLTATSNKSRNYHTGYILGKANKVTKKVLSTFATTEGLKVLDNFLAVLNKNRINAPLLQVLYEITNMKKEPRKTIDNFFKKLK